MTTAGLSTAPTEPSGRPPDSKPALQLYTGNWLTGSPKGKHGDYSDYDAVAIECQDYPDAPNHPSFPSTLLRPGERYHRTIIFRFTTK